CREGTSPKVSKAERAAARNACEQFIMQCEDAGNLFTLAMDRERWGYGSHPDAGSPEAAFGHDMYLTTARHGTGFWDREELKTPVNGGRSLGDLLAEEAHKFGEPQCEQYRGWWYFHFRA